MRIIPHINVFFMCPWGKVNFPFTYSVSLIDFPREHFFLIAYLGRTSNKNFKKILIFIIILFLSLFSFYHIFISPVFVFILYKLKNSYTLYCCYTEMLLSSQTKISKCCSLEFSDYQIKI